LLHFLPLADHLTAHRVFLFQLQTQEILFYVELIDLFFEPIDDDPEFSVFRLDELRSVVGIHVLLDSVFEEVVKIFHGSVDLVAELVLVDRVVVFEQVPQSLVELTIIQ
jgi:hypothetical protein